jgi:feruloyl esterase
MSRYLSAMMILAFAVVAIGLGAGAPAADTCANLMSSASLRAIPNTTIDSATLVSDTFTPPGNTQSLRGLPSFCRVTATLKPSPVSDIKIEIWMPAQQWNQKLQGVGNGGLAGAISYAALAPAIKNGYASVSTDTGHVASDTAWLPVEERERDYGYRAIHGMTVTAKAVAQQFYGSAPRRSYFNGCSTGGGQGFGEAQLYPQDYDGIIAGAPQDFPTHLRAAIIREFQAANHDPASNLPKNKLALVTSAVLKKCGGQYGASDGFLSDPRPCGFDPAQLFCKSGQAPATCLTAPQVSAVKKIYEGTISSHTKKLIWPGLLRGSEAPAGPGAVGWQAASINGPAPFSTGAQFYSLAVFENPNLDFRTLDLDASIAAAEKKFPFLNHTSTDIEAFTRHGGKLLMYHGWADPLISPLNSINYYGSLVETVSLERRIDMAGALKETGKSDLLFMVPGMGHCSGGPGPDTFDAVNALDTWVDRGVAPDKIIASHLANGAAAFSRPLCPYPQEAEFKGSGDRNDANNWVCASRDFKFDASFYAAGKATGK